MNAKKTPLAPENWGEMEKEVEALAPVVRGAYASIAGPSPRVLDAIHAEALAHVAQRRRTRRFIPVFRALAAAAALALLLGGAVQLRLAQLTLSHDRDFGHLLNIGEAPTVTAGEPTAEPASRLLSLQGLDEEAYFLTAEETEPLWL
jgi:hypothetical protein